MAARRRLRAAALVSCAALASCSEPAPQPEPPPPAVTVAEVVEDDILETTDFVGEVQAIESVGLRARVQGFLEERRFREGANVERDDILFLIEYGQYSAAFEQANAELLRAEAKLANANAELARKQALFDQNQLSDSSYDEGVLAQKSAAAEVQAASAVARQAALNLSYTVIYAPFSGRIGRASVDVGNLVGPEVGVLATLSKIDSVYVNFNVNERLYLAYRQEVLARDRGGEEPGSLIPRLRLSDGTLYEYAGSLDFVDTNVDASTGSIAVRVKFENPDELLLPGQYVTVLLTADHPETVLLVPQAAVQERQSGRFVLVVDADDCVEERPIVTGDRVGSRWAIDEGLAKGERVIVRGLQKVRPGTKVTPTRAASRSAAEG